MNPTTPNKRSLTSNISIASKKLKRLPHVFAQVLELPFSSDADVSVQESPKSFRFLAASANAHHFRAHVIKISPGIIKIQVKGPLHDCHSSIQECDDDDDRDDDDVDTWRVRLPSTALPEMAMAECIGGQLVVTVPKVNNLHCDIDVDN
ncbi:hypothetical protein M5689_003698 [Euphorbia peplus]|nr:hypothetical protein M5689_003698 [Euphorbia peplus]